LHANENKKPEDIPVIVKFFNPCGSWTWYAVEWDQKDIFFGFVRGMENELGALILGIAGTLLLFLAGLAVAKILHKKKS
ncbi:MAG: DUF2958 domain-containing protein, partial [Candidatus Bathyarchaeota archaeon]